MRTQKSINMAEIALMSAVICVLAPISIPQPFSPIPLTLATFVIHLTAALLGPKKGTMSVLIYLFVGMVGLPVFSGFSGGIGVLAGPTGGYIIGYIPCALLVGWLVEQRRVSLTMAKNRWQQVGWNVLAMTLGTLVCYLVGTICFLMVMKGTYSLTQALLVCVVPYLVFDAVKIFAAAALAVPVKNALFLRS